MVRPPVAEQRLVCKPFLLIWRLVITAPWSVAMTVIMKLEITNMTTLQIVKATVMTSPPHPQPFPCTPLLLECAGDSRS